jgi:hypothetical protein
MNAIMLSTPSGLPRQTIPLWWTSASLTNIPEGHEPHKKPHTNNQQPDQEVEGTPLPNAGHMMEIDSQEKVRRSPNQSLNPLMAANDGTPESMMKPIVTRPRMIVSFIHSWLTQCYSSCKCATIIDIDYLNLRPECKQASSSCKVKHINNVINLWHPHAFVLGETKTKTKLSKYLPFLNYDIHEEAGESAENHHIFKWGIVMGICKDLQIAQHVEIKKQSLKGQVITIDVILPTSDRKCFQRWLIAAYAPWNPGDAGDINDFWTDMTSLWRSTTTSVRIVI